MAFSGVENGEKLDIINIAIVESEYFNDDEIFNETFKNLSDENNESRLFNITCTDLDNSKQMLEDEKIVGYLEFKETDVDITVKSSGVKSNFCIPKFIAINIAIIANTNIVVFVPFINHFFFIV